MSIEEKNDGKTESVWMRWWKTLQDDRAGRAELRRCGSVVEAAFVEPYHRLRRMMGNPNGEMELKRLGLIAVVLAHVDRDAPNDKSFAETMADGEKPIVSDVRFRQILRYRSQEIDELLRDLVRVLRQVKGNAPIEKLSEDLWWWNDKMRRRWALEYYDKAKPERDAQPQKPNTKKESTEP